MNKQKNNRSGFTLIELVVVMSMMGILLGAIISFMEPVNRAFLRAESVKNTNQVGSGLNRYIERNVRYATNVLVLTDYQGVPKVSNSGRVGSAVGAHTQTTFTDCIILDNSHKRGSQLKNFDPTSTAGRRMGCTGTILHIKNIDDSTKPFSIGDAEIAMTEDYYDNETYNFSAKLSYQRDLSTLNIEAAGFQYSYDRDTNTYSFTENKRFNSSRSFDLPNVNKDKGDSFFARGVNFHSKSLTDALYTTYPRQTTAPSGLTEAAQTDFYTGTGSYTYIFYTKSTNADECEVHFDCSTPSGTVPETTVRVVYNGTINSGSVPTLSNIPNYDTPYFHCTELGQDFTSASDWDNLKVTQELHFRAVYNLLPSVVTYKIRFFNVDGTLADFAKPDGAVMISSSQTSAPTCTQLPNEFKDASYAKQHVFLGWYTNISGTEVKLEDTSITSNYVHDYYPKVTTKPKVTFKVGSNVVYTDYVVKGTKVIPPVESSINIPSGNYLIGWKTSGGDDATNYTVNSDVTFKAVLSSTAPDKPVLGQISTSGGGNHISVTMVVRNNGNSVIKVWKASVQLPFTPDRIQADWKMKSTNDTNTSLYSFTTNGDTANEGNCIFIPAHGQVQVTFDCYKYNGQFPNSYPQIEASDVTLQKIS